MIYCFYDYVGFNFKIKIIDIIRYNFIYLGFWKLLINKFIFLIIFEFLELFYK